VFCIPIPWLALPSRILGMSADLCGGRSVMVVPTATTGPRLFWRDGGRKRIVPRNGFRFRRFLVNEASFGGVCTCRMQAVTQASQLQPFVGAFVALKLAPPPIPLPCQNQ
jgi:hypothetical protein